jgi:hypothetical protein
MVRWYIIWRNNHAYDERLRRIVSQPGQMQMMRALLWRRGWARRRIRCGYGTA